MEYVRIDPKDKYKDKINEAKEIAKNTHLQIISLFHMWYYIFTRNNLRSASKNGSYIFNCQVRILLQNFLYTHLQQVMASTDILVPLMTCFQTITFESTAILSSLGIYFNLRFESYKFSLLLSLNNTYFYGYLQRYVW